MALEEDTDCVLINQSSCSGGVVDHWMLKLCLSLMSMDRLVIAMQGRYPGNRKDKKLDI